ncbi:Alpha/beta hydrolase fold-1 [Aspergillus aurantiobrunneus]
MAPPTQKTTLIFAAGSWYPSNAFDPLCSILQSQGYVTKSVAWPSTSRASAIKDLSEDIATLRALIEPEVLNGGDVVVIAHSWAGLPVNSGLEGLMKPKPSTGAEAGGDRGGVVKLLFISAFLPEVGESVISTFGREAEWYVKDEQNNTVFPTTPFELLFHDVPDGRAWAETLRPFSWATTNSRATGAAYLSIPSSYLFCEEDQAIPLFGQQAMVDKARENGAQMRTETVKTGHTPWLVDGEWVAGWIRREIEQE